MRTTSRPLYSWHVPKTAGTSFIEWLDSQFPPDDVFAPQLLPELHAATDQDAPEELALRDAVNRADRLVYRLAFGHPSARTMERAR